METTGSYPEVANTSTYTPRCPVGSGTVAGVGNQTERKARLSGRAKGARRLLVVLIPLSSGGINDPGQVWPSNQVAVSPLRTVSISLSTAERLPYLVFPLGIKPGIQVLFMLP